MFAVTGAVHSVEDIHDAVRRMEEGAALCYDQLAIAVDLIAAADAAVTLRSLAAAARRRAKTFSDTPPPPADTARMEPAFPVDGLELDNWRVLDLALDMEYAMLTHLEVLEALTETDAGRAEATKMAERKRLHLAELDIRQGKYPTPGDFLD